MDRTPAGFRLRQTRRQRGITQAALAAKVGISPSYLNLIERRKAARRRRLLQRLAEALELDLDEVTGAETSRLVQDLTEITADPLLRDLAIDAADAQEIVGRLPAWGRAVVRLHRSYRQASMLSETLADRLAHDSNLLEASHELLTRMTSIRSFSEILREHADIEPERRERFTALIAEESGKLGDIAKAVFERLSDFGESARPATPAEEVDDFIIDRRSYFSELEDAAAALAEAIAPGDVPGEPAIADWLSERHGIGVETVAAAPLLGEHAAGRLRSGGASLPHAVGPAAADAPLPTRAPRFLARRGGAGHRTRARPAPHLRCRAAAGCKSALQLWRRRAGSPLRRLPGRRRKRCATISTGSPRSSAQARSRCATAW